MKFFRRCEPHSPYHYVPGPARLGIGVGNEALLRPHLYPPDGIWGPRYNVRHDMGVTEKGYVKEAQDLPNVSLQANGVYLSGTLALQQLSDFNAKNGKS